MSFQASAPDPDRDSAAVQQFLAQTEATFRAHPLWAGATEEELESAGEVRPGGGEGYTKQRAEDDTKY